MLSSVMLFVFCILAICAIATMVWMAKAKKHHSEYDPYLDDTGISMGAHWKAREILRKHITKSANAKMLDWSYSNRVGFSTEELFYEFERKSNAFKESVRASSDVDIPEYFALIIGYEELVSLVREHENSLSEVGIAVYSGSNVIYIPPRRKEEENATFFPIETD